MLSVYTHSITLTGLDKQFRLSDRAAPLSGTNTRTGHGNTKNNPRTRTPNKNNSIRVQEENLREKHTLAYANKKLAKGARQQKGEKDIYIYIYIFFLAST
jgi:hypothetical protein